MRKSINICLCLALAFSLSLNISAQSTEKELDQVELMKQWIGTWESEIGDDSVSIFKCTPLNNGLHLIQEEKSNGNTYATYRGVAGFSDDKNMILMSFLTPSGTALLDVGKFVEKNKYIADRYFGDITHATNQLMVEFSPESVTARWKWRGKGMNWPKEWSPGMTYKKID